MSNCLNPEWLAIGRILIVCSLHITQWFLIPGNVSMQVVSWASKSAH